MRLALDRTIVQSCTLVCLESYVGSHRMDVILHLYVCPFVSERTERKLYLNETPMYFNHVAYFVYIILYYVVWDYLH